MIMLGFLKIIRGLLEVGGALIITVFSLISVYSMLKWGSKIKTAWYEIAKNPITIVFFIIVAVILIILFYKYVLPLFPKI